MILFMLINTNSLTSLSYVLIEFDDGGGVAVVRKTWITPRKREVFWPPMKDPKTFNKVLENTLHPDIEKWKLYSILRCLYETDDLQKAQQKCKLSEVTSDLQTDNQEVEIFKRKVTVPRRFISSEEENDNIYIRPPKLKKKFFNTNKNTRKNIPISEQMIQIAISVRTDFRQMPITNFQGRKITVCIKELIYSIMLLVCQQKYNKICSQNWIKDCRQNRAELVNVIDGRSMAEIEQDLCDAIRQQIVGRNRAGSAQ